MNTRPSSCCSCTFAVLLEELHEVHLVFAEFFLGGSALFCPPALVRCWGQVGLEERFAANCPIFWDFHSWKMKGETMKLKKLTHLVL